MRFVDYFLSITVSLFLFISCSKDDLDENNISKKSNIEFKVKSNKQQLIFQDLEYGSHFQQKYDIYKPENSNTITSKVIILIHGGGWINGDKSNMMNIVSIIQELNPNHTIVNMNYRLADSSNYAFPNQFNDIKKIINHLSERKEYFNIIPEFALIGRSAGGHLALMYDSVYDQQDNVKMVCALAGPSNFSIPFYTENPNFEYLFNMLVDESYYQFYPNILKTLSPFYKISRNNSPTLLFHGINDETVPFENSQTLSAELNNKNIPVKLFKLNEGHASWNQESMEKVKINLHYFINEHL